VIFVTENSNKLQKTMFWKEKSVENVPLLKVYHSIQVRGNWDVCLWYSWKDLDEHDLTEFIS
jgi:hypothetical protein